MIARDVMEMKKNKKKNVHHQFKVRFKYDDDDDGDDVGGGGGWHNGRGLSVSFCLPPAGN